MVLMKQSGLLVKKLARLSPKAITLLSILLLAGVSHAQVGQTVQKTKDKNKGGGAFNVEVKPEDVVVVKDKKPDETTTARAIEQLKIDQDLQNLTNNSSLYIEKAVFAFESRGEAGVQPLANFLRSNKNNDRIVSSVLYTFGRMGSNAAKAVPVIVPYLKNKNREIRGTAVASLGKIGRPAEPAISLIQELLFDEDEWVRERAYKSLLDMRTSKSRKLAKEYKRLEDIKLKRKRMEEFSKASEQAKIDSANSEGEGSDNEASPENNSAEEDGEKDALPEKSDIKIIVN
jgi:hypothetical protein